MDQYAMLNKADEERLRYMARAQVNAQQNIHPMGGYGQLAFGNMLFCSPDRIISGPYESQSMNRKLADAKKFLASRA